MAARSAAAPEQEAPGNWRWLSVNVVVIALIVGLRCVALRSDPYPRLDWSAGLLTDEGFYTHNARNVVLFGHARTDEFNNMILSPLLHGLQVLIFRAFGVGSLQARAISVACSLATLALLWDALRRAFDRRVAFAAVVILGLDHANLLYNRMALMDTPAALGAVAAYWAFVRSRETTWTWREPGWLVACGGLLAVTVLSRTLCVFLLPVPFIALCVARSTPRVAARALCVGGAMALVLAVWLSVWYLPHRQEIAHMTRFYRVTQIQPRTARELGHNLSQALVGDNRGITPYLFRHLFAVWALALTGIAGAMAGRLARRRTGMPSVLRAEVLWLGAWLVLGVACLSAISYSPSRYYVSMYPALASVAALALCRPAAWLKPLRAACPVARTVGAGVAWLIVFHAVAVVVHHRGLVPGGMRGVALLGLPSLVAVAVWLAPRKRERDLTDAERTARGSAAWLAPVALAVWLGLNGYWIADWARCMRWTQYETSLRLGRTLPPSAVLIGDVAPGLCMDNRLMAVNVMPGLCNYRDPVGQFAGRPRYIAILDGRWKERYWLRNWPERVRPADRLFERWVLRWPIGVYAVRDGKTEVGIRKTEGTAPSPRPAGTPLP